MTRGQAFSAYQTAMQTTPPLQTVVLLYDGILVRVNKAAQAAARGDYGEQFNQSISAVAVFRGLLAALDDKASPEIAAKLREVYELNMRALSACIGRPNAEACLARIADGIRSLRNSWAEIAGMPVLETPRPILQ